MQKIYFLLTFFLLLNYQCIHNADIVYTIPTEDIYVKGILHHQIELGENIRDSVLIQKILYSSSQPDIHTIHYKSKVYVSTTLKENIAHNLNFSMETRIQKDSIFWTSMQYFGIEIIRIKATKDSFLIKIIGEKKVYSLYELMQSQYNQALAYIQQKAIEKNQPITKQLAGLEDLKMILAYVKHNQQNIFLLMNMCFGGNYPLSYKPEYDSMYLDNTNQYIFKQAPMIIIFNDIDKKVYPIKTFLMLQNEFYAGVTFLPHESLGNYILPKGFLFFSNMMYDKPSANQIQLKIEHKSIQINKQLTYPMPL